MDRARGCQGVRAGPGAGGRPSVRTGEVTLPRTERRRQATTIHPDGLMTDDGQAICSAATRGDAHRTAPAARVRAGDVTLWPNLPVARDHLGRTGAAGSPASAATTLMRRFEMDRARGPHVLQGNRQNVALVGPCVRWELLAWRAELGREPLWGGFRDVIRGEAAHRRPDRPAVHPSWPRSRRSATGSPSSAPAGRSRPARWTTCATSPGRRSGPSCPARRTASPP